MTAAGADGVESGKWQVASRLHSKPPDPSERTNSRVFPVRTLPVPLPLQLLSSAAAVSVTVLLVKRHQSGPTLKNEQQRPPHPQQHEADSKG